MTDRTHGRTIAGWLAVAAAGLVTVIAAGHSMATPAARTPAPPTGRDLWIVTGQSNSEGWALLKAPIEPDPRISAFDLEKGWIPATEPMNPHFSRWTPEPIDQNFLFQRTGVTMPAGLTPQAFLDRLRADKTPHGGVGLALLFAKHLLPHVARDIGIVRYGVGSAIARWDPGPDDKAEAPLYRDLVRRIHGAASGGTFKGVIWYQGESDALTPGAADRYEAALARVLTGIRRETRQPDLPAIVVQSGRLAYPFDTAARSLERVREAQRQVSLKMPHVALVPSHDLVLEDTAHIGFEGYLRLAPRIGEVALSQVYRLRGHGSPLALASAELFAIDHRRPMIRVRFTGVTGRLRAAGRPNGFELRAPRPAQDPGADYPREKAALPVFSVYRIDFDPADPGAVILGLFDASPILLGKTQPLCDPVQIVYAPGVDPYTNIVDDRDMALPAFGPVTVTRPPCPKF